GKGAADQPAQPGGIADRRLIIVGGPEDCAGHDKGRRGVRALRRRSWLVETTANREVFKRTGSRHRGWHLVGAAPLWVEPYVFEAEVIDDAVGHHRPALHPRLPAISKAVVEDDRSGAVLGELSLDFPDEFFALVGVALGRLPIEQLFQLRVAVAGVV